MNIYKFKTFKDELFNKVFQDIKNYEGLYKISKGGEIWSMKTNKILVLKKNKICLIKNNITIRYSIIRLLELQFVNTKRTICKLLKEELFNAVFQDLKDYEGLYKISKNGEIWSCCYKIIMIDHQDEKGYYKILLKNNEKKTHHTISRLLALQYIPNPDNKPEVDHINRNPSDNRLCNLRWFTRVENANNKTACLALKSEKELEKHTDDLREYQRVWAEQNRRKLGQKIKSEMIKSKEPGYSHEQRKQRIANMNEEELQNYKEHISHLAKENYKNNGGNEKQHIYLQKQDVKDKRNANVRLKIANRTEEEKEQDKIKHQIAYEKNKENLRIIARERSQKKRASMTEEELEICREKRRVT